MEHNRYDTTTRPFLPRKRPRDRWSTARSGFQRLQTHIRDQHTHTTMAKYIRKRMCISLPGPSCIAVGKESATAAPKTRGASLVHLLRSLHNCTCVCAKCTVGVCENNPDLINILTRIRKTSEPEVPPCVCIFKQGWYSGVGKKRDQYSRFWNHTKSISKLSTYYISYVNPQIY